MVVSRFYKWLLSLNVFIWCVLSIIDDFKNPMTSVTIILIIIGLAKAYIASEVIKIIFVQPEKIS